MKNAQGILRSGKNIAGGILLWVLIAPLIADSAHFAESQTLITGVFGMGKISTYDFNKDSTPDFAVPCTTLNKVKIFISSASLTWPATPLEIAINSPNALVTLDMDCDGDLDIAVLSDAGKIYILENLNGDGSNWASTEIITGLTNPTDIVQADFDRDGDPDLIISEPTSGYLSLIKNRVRNGLVWELTHLKRSDATTIIFRGVQKLAVYDLGPDGMLDILTTGDDIGGVAGIKNTNRTSNWVSQGTAGLPPAYAPSFVTTGLIGHDIYRDTAGISSRDDNIAISNCYELEDESRHNFTVTYDPDRGTPLALAFADLDQDGDGDLIFSSSEGVFWNELTCSLTGQITFGSITELSATLQHSSVLQSLDLDRDGDLDILASDTSTGMLVWFENMALHSGIIVSATSSIAPSSHNLNQMASMDLDENGRLDIFAPELGTRSQFQYLQNDDPTQQWSVEEHFHPFGDVPVALACDINLDGHREFIQPSFMAGNISWSPNPPETGGYVLIADPVTKPYATCAADFDRDGDPDLLLADYWATNASYFEQTSTNQTGVDWAQHATNGFLYSSAQFLTSDFNSDGRMDILDVGDTTGLAYLENTGTAGDGSIQWQTKTVLAYNGDYANLLSAKLADIDSNGVMDTVVIKRNLGIEWIHTPQNPWTDSWNSSSIPLSSHAVVMTVGDVDQDGDEDIVFLTEAPVQIYFAEQTNPDTQTFFTHSLYTVPNSDTQSVKHLLMEDFNINSIRELVYQGNYSLFKAQLEKIQITLEVPSLERVALPGETVDILALRVHHQGKAEDVKINLKTLALRFSDEFNTPITSLEAQEFMSSLRIFRDNGNNTFDEATDTFMGNIPLNLVNGELSASYLITNDFKINGAGWAVYFIVATIGNRTDDACQFNIEMTDNMTFSHEKDIDLIAKKHFISQGLCNVDIAQSELNTHLEGWPVDNILVLLNYTGMITTCN